MKIPGNLNWFFKVYLISACSTSILLLTFAAFVSAQVPLVGRCPEVKIVDQFDVNQVSRRYSNLAVKKAGYFLIKHAMNKRGSYHSVF